MEKYMNESYHTSSTLEQYASIWGTWFPVHDSIGVVSLGVRNTEIIITGTSPTSTATTFGNLVTVRLDHGWQTKGFHWPCWVRLETQRVGNQDENFNHGLSLSLQISGNYYKIQNGFATLPKKQSANLQTRCMCKQLVRRESNLQTSAASNTKKKHGRWVMHSEKERSWTLYEFDDPSSGWVRSKAFYL